MWCICMRNWLEVPMNGFWYSMPKKISPVLSMRPPTVLVCDNCSITQTFWKVDVASSLEKSSSLTRLMLRRCIVKSEWDSQQEKRKCYRGCSWRWSLFRLSYTSQVRETITSMCEHCRRVNKLLLICWQDLQIAGAGATNAASHLSLQGYFLNPSQCFSWDFFIQKSVGLNISLKGLQNEEA